MSGEIEEFVFDIAKHENRLHGDKFSISTLSPLGLPPSQERSSDSAIHFKIGGVQAKDDAIISVSNAQFPEAVAGAVERGAKIATYVEERAAKPIVRPILSGRFGNQSYAFWSEHKPLSKNRLMRKIQLMSINRHVLDWLGYIGNVSGRAIVSELDLYGRYIKPIRYLINDDDIPMAVKSVAHEALEIVESGKFQAVEIVQHGDLWHGNIMLAKSWPMKSGDGQLFYVIDWGGSNTHGYPYADLVRYMVSIHADANSIATEIGKYGLTCGLENEHVHAYICAGLGHLGMNRNEFPADVYLRLCEAMIAAMPKHETSSARDL